MNVLDPISTLMTTKLVTVNPKDNLLVVKDIFDTHSIHHLPVVRYKKLVGLISKTDMLSFFHGVGKTGKDKDEENAVLRKNYAEDIMTKGIAKLGPNERINVAVQLFNENLFHAIPVVEEDELVGILTTYDIIRSIGLHREV